MGYYALHHEGEISIPLDKQDEILAELATAYEEHNASRMALWTIDIPTDLEQEIIDRGFDFMIDADQIVINAFDSKWHSITDVFLHTILKFTNADPNSDTSAMSFRGEDGAMWRFTRDGVQNATIVWE